MRLIHCADLHLDSKMEANLPAERAKERNSEILDTFRNLVEFAAGEGIDAILVSGDLFDSVHMTKRTQQYVLDLIRRHSSLLFFYLAGNHDKGTSLKGLEDKPENLYTFDAGWRSYRLGEVTVTGSEEPDPDSLVLDEGTLNIVMLHGQRAAGSGKAGVRDGLIHLADYKNKGIDYLALGHLHAYSAEKLDERGTVCYSGCLEGRGFDECGKKGYVLLETEEHRVIHTFVPFARRMICTAECDVTGAESQLELETRLLDSVANLPADSLVKSVLIGKLPTDVYLDTDRLCGLLSDRFYFAKLENKSRLNLSPEDFRYDVSLRGEFVRRVYASDLPEEEKERVIACGLRALAGEEIGL